MPIRWYQKLPLSGKFNLIIIASVVISLGLLIGLYTGVSSKTTIDRAIDSGLRNLDLVADNVNSVIRHADALSRVIVSDKFLQGISSERYTATEASQITDEYQARIILDGIIQQRDVVSSVVIRMNDGRLFGSGHVGMSELVGKPSEYESMPDDFFSIWQDPVLLPTRPIEYEVKELMVNNLALVRQFISVEEANVVGLIVMNIRESTIRDYFNDENTDTSAGTMLVEGNGRIIVSSSPDQLYDSVSDQPYYSYVMEEDTGSRIVHLDGTRQLLVHRTLDSTGWKLIRIIPLVNLLASGRRLNAIVLIAGFICVILATLVSVLLSRTITQRVRALTEAMDLAGQGDLEVRVEEGETDEVGKMTRYFNRMVEQISDLMAEVYQEQSDKRRFELMALQAQIRPHFLYNALDGVCALIQTGSTEDAFRMGKALSLFYRGALSGGKNIVSVADELDIVDQYLTILSFRYADTFTYSIDIPSKFNERRALKLSLQPIVENSVYHGIRGIDGIGHIDIFAEDFGDTYHLIVRDNGKGFKPGCTDGFGMTSVRERIRIYFGESGDLSVSSEPGRTEVRIILPAERSNYGR